MTDTLPTVLPTAESTPRTLSLKLFEWAEAGKITSLAVVVEFEDGVAQVFATDMSSAELHMAGGIMEVEAMLLAKGQSWLNEEEDDE